jgi:hypothetical protein
MSSPLVPALAVLLCAAPPGAQARRDREAQARAVQVLLRALHAADLRIPAEVLDCRSVAYEAEFLKLGLRLEPGAKVAWATDAATVRVLAREGRFVLCPDAALLAAGACVALETGSGLRLRTNPEAVAASGVRFPPAPLLQDPPGPARAPRPAGLPPRRP